jgi:tripartite-type tricarboxylate transporter receptor subunit TctC
LVTSFDVLPIATWTAERLPDFKDVPTMKELGYNYDIYNWVGAYAPKGTPQAVMDKLASSLEKTIKDPAVVAALQKLKVEVSYMPPKEFGAFTAAESVRNRALLQAADLLAK